MKLTEIQIKPLLKLLAIVMITAACSQRQKKSNTENSTDRSNSINYNHKLSFISSADDTLATINIAVADNEDERSEGLMDVNHLPEDNGMLFIFDKEQQLSFWMANTPLPLDIIFVNKDKEIVRIHHSTKPFTQQNFASEKPALYAVETNGGFCVARDIQEGAKIAFQINNSE